MRQELEEFVTRYSTPPNQGIPLATSPPSMRQEQPHINGSPIDEADESVTFLDDSWSWTNGQSQSVSSSQSSVSLNNSGMVVLQEEEHFDEAASSVGEADQAIQFPPSPDPEVQVIDLSESLVEDFPRSRRDSEEPSLNAAFHLLRQVTDLAFC